MSAALKAPARLLLGVLLLAAIWPVRLAEWAEHRFTRHEVALLPGKIAPSQGRTFRVKLPREFEDTKLGFVVEGTIEHRGRQVASIAQVAERGGGTFILRGRNLYFSTVDGSDPRSNGRECLWRVPLRVAPWVEWVAAACALWLLGPWLRRAGARLLAGGKDALKLWNGPEWPLAYAMCRIAFGAIFCMQAFAFNGAAMAELVAGKSAALYDPLGVLKLLGAQPLPPGIWLWVAPAYRIAAVAVVLGFCSRSSFAFAYFCCYCIDAVPASYELAWSHGHVPELLAGLVMLCGPRQSRLAVDALWYRGGDPAGSRFTIMALQAMVGLLFLNAALYKLWLGNGALGRWCFSDSFRNHVLFQYWVLQQPLPDWLAWFLSEPWRWQAMAVGNMLGQTMPILAIFLARRPWLRALCGVFLIIEVVGLGSVMQLWNPQWLWLGAFFVDWDALWSKLRPLPGRTAGPQFASRGWPARQIAIGVLLLAQFAVSHFSYDQLRWSFPLSSAPMYSSVLATPPYGMHLPWLERWSAFDIDCQPPLSDAHRSALWRDHYGIVWMPPEHRRARIAAILRQLSDWHYDLRRFTLSRCDWHIEPAPSLAITPVRMARVFEWRAGQTTWVEWRLSAADQADKRLTITRWEDDRPTPAVFTLEWSARGERTAQPLPSRLVDGQVLFRPPDADAIWVQIRDTRDPPDELPWDGPSFGY